MLYQVCSRIPGGGEFRCPKLDRNGAIKCIYDSQICNHTADCPDGDDEIPALCLLYAVLDANIKKVFDFIITGLESYRRDM
ncbi:hypothetical protein SNE40_020040 [Patella caerulea]|uniref:Uncharacterized protein n=1 Tax=Patella caerulea TaxID=87958 RepID=A0AAN8IY54_PATCE